MWIDREESWEDKSNNYTYLEPTICYCHIRTTQAIYRRFIENAPTNICIHLSWKKCLQAYFSVSDKAENHTSDRKGKEK